MALTGDPRLWRADTKQGATFAALADIPSHAHIAGAAKMNGSGIQPKCPTCRTAYNRLLPDLGEREPLIFCDREGNPLPRGGERARRLRILLTAVHEYAEDFRPEAPAPAPVAPIAAPVEVAPQNDIIDAQKRLFVEEVRRLRGWIEQRDPDIDHLSYRPIKDGRKMIENGIPAAAALSAMTMHWDDSMRSQARIPAYDPASDFKGGLHAYLNTLAEARVLMMLTGPAGMGKSYWASALADRLGVPFGSIPMNEGVTPSWLLGKETMSGFKGTKFLDIWTGGGVWLWDELDAADPNMLLVINDALANGVIHNPIDQQEYVQHADFIGIAATNTLGLGADANYTGRNPLDFSTLDRFRMGRAYVGYNADVEHSIMFG